MTIYEHRQFGTVMVMLLAIPILGLLAAVGLSGKFAPLLLWLVILAVILSALVIFSSLTVQVDPAKVGLYFGLHAFRRSIPLNQIRSAQVVRNHLWDGIGIHFIPGGVLYNVSGLDAVELELVDGKMIRIGTDEPVELAQAIEEARRMQRIG